MIVMMKKREGAVEEDDVIQAGSTWGSLSGDYESHERMI